MEKASCIVHISQRGSCVDGCRQKAQWEERFQKISVLCWGRSTLGNWICKQIKSPISFPTAAAFSGCVDNNRLTLAIGGRLKQIIRGDRGMGSTFECCLPFWSSLVSASYPGSVSQGAILDPRMGKLLSLRIPAIVCCLNLRPPPLIKSLNS